MTKRRTYDVFWTDAAQSDLRSILDFLVEDSRAQAFKKFNEIRRRSKSLSQFPRRGRPVPELKAIGVEIYRELIIDPYRLLYRIMRSQVYVVGIFDARRDLEDVLFDRLVH